jgi:hypothetical protein
MRERERERERERSNGGKKKFVKLQSRETSTLQESSISLDVFT